MTLADAAPQEFSGPEFADVPAQRLARVEVAETRRDRWPGPHRNVTVWWVLKTGHAVGWNENPSRGWSFPVLAPVVVKRWFGGR